MQPFSLWGFYVGISRLHRYIRMLEEFTDEPDSRLVFSEQLKRLKQDGEQVALCLDALRFSDTPNVVSCLQTFSGSLKNLTREQMILQARQLEHAIQSDTQRLALVVLRKDQDAVIADLNRLANHSFPEAAEDAASAGDCYQIGAFDACVFHLLRVLERGLRKMAGELRVPSFHSGKIDLRNWGTLIKEMEVAIRELPNGTPEESERKERLTSVATHFWFVKNVWRNVYYHVRNSPATRETTSQFLIITKQFMGTLRSAPTPDH